MLSFPEQPPPVLTLLAHEVRWQLLRALTYSDYRVQELVELVGRPLNLVSYHLKQLRQHQLVTEHRSAADAREVYYHLDLERLQNLFWASGDAMHPAMVPSADSPAPTVQAFEAQPLRILFLCTHNSARSQMAEGIARSLGRGYVEAFSAGSEIAAVHPDAMRAMADVQIDISQQSSKHFDQFIGQSFDYIVTVCDRVRESCPVFPNDPERIHWSFADPALIDDPDERYTQFQSIARQLMSRISYLFTLAERKRVLDH